MLFCCTGISWDGGSRSFPPVEYVYAASRDHLLLVVSPTSIGALVSLMRCTSKVRDGGMTFRECVRSYDTTEREAQTAQIVGFEFAGGMPPDDEFPHVNSRQRRRIGRKKRRRYGNPPVGSGFVIERSYRVKTPNDKKREPGELPTAIEAKWNAAAAMPGIEIPLGDVVVCDGCMTDWRGRSESGGLIFESKAIGPCCEKRWMEGVNKHNEGHLVRAKCPAHMSFWHFVLSYRRETGSETIRITTGEGALAAISGRRRAAKGPACGHSACSQNYIDTGETACVSDVEGEPAAPWWRRPMTQEQQFELLDTTHTYGCDCDRCVTWWALMGPDGGDPGEYGPFTTEQVNARQSEIGVEVTP